MPVIRKSLPSSPWLTPLEPQKILGRSTESDSDSVHGDCGDSSEGMDSGRSVLGVTNTVSLPAAFCDDA